jgi:RimJ/RimL family protein N-acetyltransferase
MKISEIDKILVLKKTLKNKCVIIKPMNLNNINQNFIKNINKKEINQFTQIQKKKQNYKTCYEYYVDRLKNKELYYSVNTFKGEFIGTMTMREISKYSAYFGILIFNKNYHGSEETKIATNIFLDYCFKKLPLNSIKVVTFKKSLGANFLYLTNNFKKFKSDKKSFHFRLQKIDLLKKYKYKVF